MSRASIESLYRTYGPAVARRALAILGDEAAAKDAMQEVFIRALRAGLELREDASPMTWLYRVTTNYCLNQRRDRRRQSEILEARAPGEAARPEPESGPESRLAVLELLDCVPEELAQIAVYYYVDQMNHEEIAAILGVSRRTVGNRLEAFLKAARAALEPIEEVSA